jgi:hypothetical protein
MSAMVSAGRRYLPRGWADLGRQLAIWLGFALLYQLVRGLADRKPPSVALAHGREVFNVEIHLTHRVYELTLQHFVDQKHWLELLVSWTYWNSEFTVVGLAVLWVYVRRHESFHRFRNSVLLANVIGLIVYFLLPTAPPRLIGAGFVDQHRDGLVRLAANPYAAMPSLHSADALIVGVVLAGICRSWVWRAVWIAWPGWVWFCVMATGNHFWLDCVAGLGVALVAMGAVYGPPARRLLAVHRA